MLYGLRVEVAPPDVTGETVVFRWTQTDANPYQERNEFYLRYEGVDLAIFSPALLLELFLGLQFGVWRLDERPIEVILPDSVPASSVEFWRNYHGVTTITVSPTDDGTDYSPWAGDPPPITDRRSAAVFFGGGKDSILTTCLLSEIYDANNVLAVQFVIPRRRNTRHARALEQRQNSLMLEPVRQHLGIATQQVWTDYLANMRADNYRARPHAELFTLAGLPILLSRGVSFSTFCLSRTEYGFFYDDAGQRQFLNTRSRPEVLHAQSAHYQRDLRIDLTVTNLNLLFTGLSAMRLLTARYPEGFARVVSCVVAAPDERWCYQCRKCSWYPLFALQSGAVDPEFDYDRLFRTSPHLVRMVEYALSGVELSASGNAPVDPALKEDHVFPMFCHIMATIDLGLIADRLSPEAVGNLLTIKALFGNRTYPGFEMIPAKAIALLDNEVARRVVAIASEHLRVTDDLAPPLIGDNPEMIYDFDVRMPTRPVPPASIPNR